MNIHIKNIGECQKCGFVLSSLFNDASKFGLRHISLTNNPKECDLLIIVGCLSSTQQQPLIEFFKKMPPAKKHRILSLGDCGTLKQDLFSFPDDHNLENRAIPVKDLAGIIPIDDVIEGCPPTPEEISKKITELE